ncbi:DBH-like monooxygenase protein 2 [Rhinatrema bivittatum]|uniref:DBH-like monooxygenase protein 2 n=1 Tax=Rhinatrema bivittatum TaxID=194408 RepID=UPI00112CDC1F|nr:DBH-like monooxygenase protein 2 [Rhinatrema bivittatum]
MQCERRPALFSGLGVVDAVLKETCPVLRLGVMDAVLKETCPVLGLGVVDAFEPVIQAGNEMLVHHILLYACPSDVSLSSAPGECYIPNSAFFQCWQILAAWAIGGKGLQFPDNTGLSLGAPGDAVYGKLEVHYNNPNGTFTDSSGVRLYYTNNLRQFDAGVLEVGAHVVDPYVFIPPQAQSYHLYGLCKTDKFRDVNGQDVADMQVFAYFLHTHLAGRAVEIAHFRNGSQIGFLGRDMTFDFNLQESRYMENITTVRMGDTIQVDCTYNTMDRTSVTVGGLGTMQEMCLGFLYFYPRNNISNCLSSPNLTYTNQALNLSSPSDINSIQWSKDTIDLAQRTIRMANQSIEIYSNQQSVSDSGSLSNITEPASATCNNATFDLPAATSAPGTNDASSVPLFNSARSGTLQCLTALLGLSLLFLQAALGTNM